MKSRTPPDKFSADKSAVEQAMVLARDWLAQGHRQRAFAVLARAHANPAHATEAVHLQATIAMQLEEWRCALSLLDSVMRVLPNRMSIHLDRAACLIALNRLAEARSVLEREEKRLRNQYQRYVLLARIAALERNETLATQQLKTAFELDHARAWVAAVQHPELNQILCARFLQTP